MVDPLLQLVIALSLSLLFVSASQHKRANGARFAAQLDAYALLPGAVVKRVAAGLPWIELATGVLLLVPGTRPPAALAALILLTGYALAILVNLLRGRSDIDCGCGGTAQPLSYWLVLRNAVLAIASTLLLLPPLARAMHFGDAIAMVLMTLLLGLCYLCIGQLIQNQTALQGRSQHDH